MKTKTPSYQALVTAAKSLNLPKRFETDLTVHDRESCLRAKDSQPFVWGIGEDGTHLVWKDSSIARKGAHYFRECFNHFDLTWFAWDGRDLKRLSGLEESSEWLESFVESSESVFV